jgi:GT2 family glycosyltransferase
MDGTSSMADSPRVSIFMPTFRRGESGRLQAALESVLAQEFRDFELLVADDGSTDSTAQILAAYAAQDDRIRIFRYKRNSGLPALRFAQVLSSATGRYCAHMFDDDIWYPHALAALVDALESHPTWDMTYGNAAWPYLLADGIIHNEDVLGKDPRVFDPVRLQAANYISHLAVLLRREVLDRVGVYDTHILIRRLCDWDLWLRIASVGTIGHSDVLVGRSNGRTTTDSLGRTASIDLDLTRLYMSLDRNALLQPERVLEYPVDGLEVFGEHQSPALVRRAARQFAAFYRQVGDPQRSNRWERLAASEHPIRPRVAAVVVLYRPSDVHLANVDSYIGQVDAVVAVDNTEEPDRALVAQLERRGVTYVTLGANQGLAASR